MPRKLLFWVIFLLFILFTGIVFTRGVNDWPVWSQHTGNILEVALIGLLGWQCYGKPITD